VLAIARAGRAAGCHEALFTLGDQPELRWAQARDQLQRLGYETTLDYLAAMARRVAEETGLLPHLNPGIMSGEALTNLRPHAASMGIMLETGSNRLSQRGGPHFGSPDKDPSKRLDCIAQAGAAKIPFTSGILIGIGETRLERVEALLALRDLHAQYGHLQEIIVQNFAPKPHTRMAAHPAAAFEDHLWTIAVARMIFGPRMSIQAPPNLAGGGLEQRIAAGINDWGGVSPVTPDHVNPEAPWPHIDALAAATARAGKILVQRLTIYPEYARKVSQWAATPMQRLILRASDAEGFAREDDWQTGATAAPPRAGRSAAGPGCSAAVAAIIEKACAGHDLCESEIIHLFAARGAAFEAVCRRADRLRAETVGDTVTYVVTRNINYTNVCTYACRFCAFSKGRTHADLRGLPYDLDRAEFSRRVQEAWERGATEICLQGGIHPDYDGGTYLEILRAARQAAPSIHIHAFSPLEITHGARSLNLSPPAGTGGAEKPARHGGGNSRRRNPRPPVQGQAHDRGMVRRHAGGARHRAAQHRHHHVRPYRATGPLGASSSACARAPETIRRVYRIRATPVRGAGSPDFSPGGGPHGADLARSHSDARRGAPGAPPAHDEYPDILGQDGAAWRRRRARCGRQRSRRHLDG
jgi:FO synthase